MEVRELHSSVAKMMSVENITVEHSELATTAAFNMRERKIILPIWKNVSSSTYTLLIAHEVGHALHTPNYFSSITFESKYDNDVFRQIINIVEDARIEKKIFKTFPGVKPSFFEGYKELLKIKLFGDYQERLATTNDIFDRINLYFKVGRYSNNKIEITDRERKYIDRIDSCDTFEDVILASKQLYDDFIQEQLKEQQQEQLRVAIITDSSETEEKQSQEQEGESDTPDLVVDCRSDKNKESSEEKKEDKTEKPDSGSGENNKADKETENEEEPKQEQNTDTDSGEDDTDSGEDDDDADSTQEGDDTENDSESNQVSDDNDHSSTPTENIESDSKEHATIQSQIEQAINDLIMPVLERKETIKISVDDSIIDSFFERSLVSYKEFIAELLIPHDDRKNYFYGGRTYESIELRRLNFIKNSRSEITSLCNAFEIKKRAALSIKNKTHNTGTLDFEKLHTYKFNENIFKRITVEQKGKNHGLIFFIDFSSSMVHSIDSIIEQLLILLNFCKKSQIDFEVYSFTSDSTADNRLAIDRIRIINLFSSRMSQKDFDFVAQNLIIPRIYEGMRSTPLNIITILSTKIYDMFRRKYNSEIINFIFLTDGDDTHAEIQFGPVRFDRIREKSKIVIDDRRKRKQFCSTEKNWSGFFFEYLKEYTDRKCNIIKFDVVHDTSIPRFIQYLKENRSKIASSYRKYIEKIFSTEISDLLLSPDALNNYVYYELKRELSNKIDSDFYFQSLENGIDASFIINKAEYVSAIDSIKDIDCGKHTSTSKKLTNKLSKTRKNRAMIDVFIDYIS